MIMISLVYLVKGILLFCLKILIMFYYVLPFIFLQVVTAGPVVYSIILNGASQPGGQTGTALLPLFA